MFVPGISYQLAPRAKISRRDAAQVSDLAQLKLFMRSNSWSTDPLSGGNSFGAICGRGDINPKHPKASGCNDAKVGYITHWLHQACVGCVAGVHG